ARPLAPMSSIVSCMSCASRRISGAVGSATGAEGSSSTGFPIRAIRKTAMLLPPGRMVAQPAEKRLEPFDHPLVGQAHARAGGEGAVAGVDVLHPAVIHADSQAI